jgi:glycosyltransferase involved in cell wall biosynthesis
VRSELLFVGRSSDPNKGLEVLLAALARLPREVTLRCLSERPWPGDPVHDRIAALELGARVRFEGKLPREQLERAYETAALVVVPSRFEGFGLPAIEGLAAGTPVVASDAGALPEVLQLAGAGRAFRSGDARALACVIEEVLAHWSEEQRVVRAVRPRLERVFGWGSVARRTAEVYAFARRSWRGRSRAAARGAPCA